MVQESGTAVSVTDQRGASVVHDAAAASIAAKSGLTCEWSRRALARGGARLIRNRWADGKKQPRRQTDKVGIRWRILCETIASQFSFRQFSSSLPSQSHKCLARTAADLPAFPPNSSFFTKASEADR